MGGARGESKKDIWYKFSLESFCCLNVEGLKKARQKERIWKQLDVAIFLFQPHLTWDAGSAGDVLVVFLLSN